MDELVKKLTAEEMRAQGVLGQYIRCHDNQYSAFINADTMGVVSHIQDGDIVIASLVVTNEQLRKLLRVGLCK